MPLYFYDSYLLAQCREVHLWDFDGYDYVAKRMSLNDVINEPKKKMGHAFVLAMLLRVRTALYRCSGSLISL